MEKNARTYNATLPETITETTGGVRMRNDVNNRQMVFILIITMTAITTVNLPQTMAINAGTGGWITLLLSSIPYAFGTLMIVSLNKKHQGAVLFDYSKGLIGQAGAYVLAAFYMIYFLSISTYLCAGMSNVLASNFFAHTPRWAMVLISLPFYSYAAYKGITSVGRLCEIYGLFYIVVIGFAFILMFIQGDVNRILPLFVKEDVGSYLKAMRSTIPSFLGVEVLTLIPIAAKGRKKAPWAAFLAVIGVGLFFIMNVESCIMMNGLNEIKNQNNALIAVIRQIQIPVLSFFERMDFIYLTVGFMGLFAAKTIAMLGAVEYGCKLFAKANRLWVVIAAASIVFLADLVLYRVQDFGRVYEPVFLYAGNTAALFVPALLNILTKVKRNAASAA